MRISDWSSDVCSSDLVRGYSFFGDSFVYVLFDDDTDLYWARSRVLEYLSQARDQLPGDVSPVLGPDATGLGWIYQYALVDRSGRHHLGELRALQDWFLRYELKTIPDRSEEHTSELQSLMRISYAVFCLKKKNTQYQIKIIQQPSYRTQQKRQIN